MTDEVTKISIKKGIQLMRTADARVVRILADGAKRFLDRFEHVRLVFRKHHSHELARIDAERPSQRWDTRDWDARSAVLHHGQHVRFWKSNFGGYLLLTLADSSICATS